MSCPFCDVNTQEMRKRIFYRDENWYAILAAPYHNKGHVLLLALHKTAGCPTQPSLEVLSGLPKALCKTIEAIKAVYQSKDVLLTSLRGSEGHFHFHLVPLYEDEEREWRSSQKDTERYRKGHLMEFLGQLEKRGDKRAREERREAGLSEPQHRTRIIELQKGEIEKLRLATSYYDG